MNKTVKNIMDVYEFEEVTENELLELRIKLVPLLILKVGKQLFIHHNTKNFYNILKYARANQTHLCGICHRLSALPESEGGCTRISDKYLQYPFTSRISKETLEKRYISILKNSSIIEKYHYITLGIEVLSKSDISCPIFGCSHFLPVRIPTKAEPNRTAIPKQDLDKIY